MWGTYFKVNHATVVVALLQTLAAPLCCAAMLLVTTQALGVPFNGPYMALATIAALLCALLVRPVLNEQRAAFSSSWTLASQIGLAWLLVVGILLLLGYASKSSEIYSRRVLFAWFLLTPAVMAGAILMLRQWSRRTLLASGQACSAVIAGGNRASRMLIESIEKRPELGLTFKGLFDDRSRERLVDVGPEELRGRFSDLAPFVRREHIDTVFVAIPFNHLERTKTVLTELQDTTASIYYVPDVFVFDLIQSRTVDVNGIPVVALCETPFAGWRGLTKRTSDVVLASIMTLIALVPMLLIALAIKLTSTGSVIFMQRRYGLDGEEIIVYKFRTMTASDDGPNVPQVTKDDKRVTPLGRFLRRYSLDELPQLVNVLQGRMSLVGPRPHAVAHNETYRRLITGYMVRHKVAPGITGLAQVNGYRGETVNVEDMQKRVDYDLEYLRHWSLVLDLKILAKTLAVWLRNEKAY